MADPILPNLKAQEQQFATKQVADHVLEQAARVDAGEPDVQLNPGMVVTPPEPGVEGRIGEPEPGALADVTENASEKEADAEMSPDEMDRARLAAERKSDLSAKGEMSNGLPAAAQPRSP